MGAEEQEAFAQEMAQLFAEKCKGYGTNVDVGAVLRGVLGLIRKHKVRIGEYSAQNWFLFEEPSAHFLAAFLTLLSDCFTNK